MSRKKSKIKTEKKLKENKEVEKFRWNDSYVSLLVGFFVVILAGIIIFSFAKNQKFNTSQLHPSSVPSVIQKQEVRQSKIERHYSVEAGDNLWQISEKFYKSGYNWVDIAKANNLANPSDIHVGDNLVIPNVKPKILTQTVETGETGASSTQAITGSTYTVVKGDYLWDIAVKAYGDGFKWVDIAKANNLSNPDLIFSGDVLKIPR